MPTIPAAPRGTGPEGRRLWKSVLTGFDLAEHERVLLRQAARVADVCGDLQAIVDAEGLVVGDKVHPALVELRAQRLLLGRLVVALRVPSEDDTTTAGRPQHRGTRGFYNPKSAA